MRTGDTIMALSSGSLPAGVAVIRLSGPGVRQVLVNFAGGIPPARRLVLRDIGGDARIDKGLVAFFPLPNSFTGEDCAELQVHGSPAGVKAILRALQTHGIRHAEAGEFTRRAFENGKLDLTEAQGLGDFIEAETENQRALAYARMEGGLSQRVDGWRELLLDLRAEIEAQLDFSDEGDVGDLSNAFLEQVNALRNDIAEVLSTRDHGRIVRSGFRVVLAGPPNAGKSSLLNALSNSDVAIVSDEAGTTRDLKEVPLDIKGQLVILVDSAGLRETSSKAEAIGVSRAKAAMAAADLVLWLVPADVAVPEIAPRERYSSILTVGTKVDLGTVSDVDLLVSTMTGDGLEHLLEHIYLASGASAIQPAQLLVSHEQDRIALSEAHEALGSVSTLVDQAELAAECLRSASAALERLLGKMDAERVLDHLFSKFCIGK